MKITHSVEIDSPSEVVWTYLEDSDKIKQWMKGVVDDVPTSDGPTRAGSTFRMTIKEGRKLSEYDGEITAFDPHRHMTIRMTGGCMKGDMAMTVDYRLSEPAPSRTRLDYTCTASGVTGFWRLAMPIMRLFAGMQARGFLRALKALAETEAKGVPA